MSEIHPVIEAPADYLQERVRRVLDHAVAAYRDGNRVYESLRNLNEVIGTEYGDRVLYELVQNAHDAHNPGQAGRIAIRLILAAEDRGTLYIANDGSSFRKENVEAIRNIGISSKEIGEGIGNKGLGFRSIEALTEGVQIYSRAGNHRADSFDGFCFQFASPPEIEDLLRVTGTAPQISRAVSEIIPRYLIPIPIATQSEEVRDFARKGYATVIVAPLTTRDAVDLARSQVKAVATLQVPLMLFLDRIEEVRIDLEQPGDKPFKRRLHRRQLPLAAAPQSAGTRYYEVAVGEERRFLVISRDVDKDRVLEAVRQSLPKAPQLRRWLNWKGQPVVSVAVGLSVGAVTEGRLYNFLPMGDEAASPILGYVDAPFYAEIDRRKADLALPLNSALMDAAAETCLAAARALIDAGSAVPVQAIFDLVAWTGPHAGKFDGALKQTGSSLRDAKLIPRMGVDGSRGWTILSYVSTWPAVKLTVIKERDLVRLAGAHLVSRDLDRGRVERLHQMARRIFRGDLHPAGHQLADWAEIVASSLHARKAPPGRWAGFYDDLRVLFEATDRDLGVLEGKEILLDRSGRLRPAGGHSGGDQAGMFVKLRQSKGRGAKGDIPLPPSTITRRYRFLSEDVVLRRETLDAFLERDLVREYDPLQALASLRSALGEKANDNRRREALVWAFQVWLAPGTQVNDEDLRAADLHVLTLTGWQPASQCAFSASWTRIGKILENYLVEAAEMSSDCRRQRDLLLVPFDGWPAAPGDTKKNWLRFLDIIGVVDGLRPVAAQLTRRGVAEYTWLPLLRHGAAREGLDGHWRAEVNQTWFRHPYTEYQMDGEAWRLPGQVEHENLPEIVKEAFCALVLEHLRTEGTKFFQFRLGRFDRVPREHDAKILPTPLATFLRAAAWLAAGTPDGEGFHPPKECWGARTRRNAPPRFLNRLPPHIFDVVEGEILADLLFGPAIGVRDWHGPGTAVARLRELAASVDMLASNERPAFTREYLRAWQEVVETGAELPNNFSLAVNRNGQITRLAGDADNPSNVIVTREVRRFEARILSQGGHAVLEVGDAGPEAVAKLIESSGVFAPRLIDGIGVRLVVDGEDFSPKQTDPLLVSLGLSWLPQVAVLAHELKGEAFERVIPSSTIERRVRSIRVRHCQSISLVVDGKELAGDKGLGWYAVEHEAQPTLILTSEVALDWPILARSLSGDISRLVDTRLRSLEQALLHLGYDHPPGELAPPSEEALAEALRCDLAAVRDHLAALRTDLGHVLELLVPVVCYYKDAELARRLLTDAEKQGAKFDLRAWLRTYLGDIPHSAELLVEACEGAADRVTLRRNLELDYARFNASLGALGEPTLSNELELRRLYEAYLASMRPEIVERLRRHHLADFQASRDLALYLDRKSLTFLSFDPGWVETRETLDMEVVRDRVSRILDTVLGADGPGSLMPLNRLLDGNRKAAREFAAKAIPVVRAWCRGHQVSAPALWQDADAQSLVRHLENAGLLDFVPVEVSGIADLCDRAGSWPTGMPVDIDHRALGLEENDIKAEVERRDEERHRQETARRTVTFGEHPLDTGDPNFALAFQTLAEQALGSDDGWFKRSKSRTKLVEFEGKEAKGGQGGGGKREDGPRRPERQLPEAQRQAMGLASEWLAYRYLLRRHAGLVDETAWVSKNRTRFFGGAPGDDMAGYDFVVRTPQAEWLYEVKSSQEDSGEFEMSANEMRVAGTAAKDGRRRYRILYVPYVFSPDKWCVLELPNPMGEDSRRRFKEIGRGSVRFRFERK